MRNRDSIVCIVSMLTHIVGHDTQGVSLSRLSGEAPQPWTGLPE